MKTPIYYISTNEIWGGSEELWTRSAKALSENMSVHFAAAYTNKNTADLANRCTGSLDMSRRYTHPSLLQKVLAKLSGKVAGGKDLLKEQLSAIRPRLVVISQGNNIAGLPFMLLCQELNLPYATVTQLVTEAHWLGVNQQSLHLLRESYRSAAVNYFVSAANRVLHEFMIGEQLRNAEVIYNPFSASVAAPVPYPPQGDTFDIAAVGRIECFHKGYDLLVKVLAQDKWKSRGLRVTFYGDGPHRQLLQDYVSKQSLDHLQFAGHVADILQVWKKHQLLILPSRMEGQSLALIEAMWCGRGAITTMVGGAVELIEEGRSGFLCEFPSLESIDECLERAWKDRDRWKEIGENAGSSIRARYPANPVAYFNEKLRNVIG